MNVLQRPLFRQAGGPIAPPQAMPQGMPQGMPPGMPPAGVEQQLQATEQAAAQNMQQVGQEYMAQTMGALDAAETPKDVIDAIRGNALPIEARYQELASLVGEQDAMRTPETVLALVQPTIMMTEQGAMDSGIGELMQSITGQIDMETEGGQPTPMAGGVGSLMMAGAQPEEVGQPPVANFSQGGYVRRFQQGGAADSRLGQLYTEMLPTYESILGGNDEDAKAQALFAIAQAAGQFAAGRGPQGEDLRGTSMAGQLGAALGGLSGTLGAQAAERRKTQSATRLAALQAAQTESAAEAKYARDLALARAKEGDEFKTTVLYNRETGEPVDFETGTSEGRNEARAALASGNYTSVAPEKPGDMVVLYNPEDLETSITAEIGTTGYSQALRMGFRSLEDIEALKGLVSQDVKVPEVKIVQFANGETKSYVVSTPEGAEAYQAALREEGATPVTQQGPREEKPPASRAELREVITDQDTLDNLENLNPQEFSRFAAMAAEYAREETTPAGTFARLALPDNTAAAMRRAHAEGKSFPGIDPTLFGAAPRAEELDVTALNILDPETDLKQATGFLSGLGRAANYIAGQVSEFVGGQGTVFVNTAQGTSALKALAAATRRFYLEGKTLALEFALLQDELVNPSMLRTDQGAVRALMAQRELLAGDLARVQEVLENPRGYTNTQISQARNLQTFAQQLMLTYDDFIDAYGGPPATPAGGEVNVFDPKFWLNPDGAPSPSPAPAPAPAPSPAPRAQGSSAVRIETR